ncbi:cytochrome P450 [Gordonia polyisoprenivorans]|uniref:cytochrome P450 n=1 Tax=Gordonia polyisoprenivorans TaxID=84595 RepID=UPI001AD64618|nr:cytochrome P450 [Gordonia polyisoprenivorans]QTI68978.1 cytochrome P450 [Gordonia polyisoprenivorans]
MTTSPQSRPYDPLNISSLEFWSSSPRERDVLLSELRRERPVSWQPPAEGGMAAPENDGYWAVTSHEFIKYVSRTPELFCSGEGIQMEEIPSDILEAVSGFLAMDGQRHKSLRKLVSNAFTPKQVKRLEAGIRDRAATIVERLLEIGEGDFVQNVSKLMPMNTFYDVAGLPAQYREEAAKNADEMAAWNDPDIAEGRQPGEVLMDGAIGNLAIGLEFAEMTRAQPRDDVWTNLVSAEVDGRHLTDEELATMFVLLSFAGNDTTRTSISLGTKAFLDHPDQIAYLLEDFDGRINHAIEEVLRWVTPIMTFRRTATEDTVLGGQQIRKGDWVVMFYASGNRDETVFEDPWKFDVSRTPRGHVAFGGGGPHFCIGSFLAQAMLRHMFDQILHRIPDLSLGEPELLVGNFAGAVKKMSASTGCPVMH